MAIELFARKAKTPPDPEMLSALKEAIMQKVHLTLDSTYEGLKIALFPDLSQHMDFPIPTGSTIFP